VDEHCPFWGKENEAEMPYNDRDIDETTVSAAFVLRGPLEDISAIKSAIEERGWRIVFQKISAGKLYICTEPPANFRERNGNGDGRDGR
jgi:hypothetical protein